MHYLTSHTKNSESDLYRHQTKIIKLSKTQITYFTRIYPRIKFVTRLNLQKKLPITPLLHVCVHVQFFYENLLLT